MFYHTELKRMFLTKKKRKRKKKKQKRKKAAGVDQ